LYFELHQPFTPPKKLYSEKADPHKDLKKNQAGTSNGDNFLTPFPASVSFFDKTLIGKRLKVDSLFFRAFIRTKKSIYVIAEDPISASTNVHVSIQFLNNDVCTSIIDNNYAVDSSNRKIKHSLSKEQKKLIIRGSSLFVEISKNEQ
jgi:hypothetical protein